MTDPRDFLPAKYKKNQTAEDFNDSFISKDNSRDHSLDRIDSPWSDLGKEQQIPKYRSSILSEEKPKEDSHDFTATLNNDIAQNSNHPHNDAPQKNTFVPKKRPNNKLTGLLVVFFLVIGVFSSYLLSQQNQDVRQQAYKANFTHPRINGITPVPTSTIIPQPSISPGYFGQCVGSGCTGNLAENWSNPNVLIRGTYPCSNDSGRCLVGGSGAAATANAAIGFAYDLIRNNPGVVTPGNVSATLNIIKTGDGVSAVELIPFVPCSGSTASYCSAENTFTCTAANTNGECQIGTTYSYITEDQFNSFISNGQTWVPNGVGGVEGWHFTTCSDQGTGIDLLGCGANQDTGDDDDQEVILTPPPTKIPTTITITTTITSTPPPTITTTAPGPVCSNIEMLDSTGNVMTADDDEDLKNGDQVKFRATATNTSSAAVTYEFRIWAPNMSTWIDITNTNSASGAANVSATYTIISSGHHVVQSRICVSGVCQAWETVAGAPTTAQIGTACTTDASCAAGYYCYIDPTPSGAQTLVAPTGNYCKAKQNCTTNANCAAGQTCYQPPMPVCPSGMGCTDVMPAKFCKEQ